MCESLKKLALEACALTKGGIDLRLLADDDTEKIQSLPTDFVGFQLGYNQAVERRNKAVLDHLRAMERWANSFLSKVRSWRFQIEQHPAPKLSRLATDHCYEQFKVRRDHFVGTLSATMEEGERPVTEVPNAVGPNATMEEGEGPAPEAPNAVGSNATLEEGDGPVPEAPNAVGSNATMEEGNEATGSQPASPSDDSKAFKWGPPVFYKKYQQ